jgi:hypothetical protein
VCAPDFHIDSKLFMKLLNGSFFSWTIVWLQCVIVQRGKLAESYGSVIAMDWLQVSKFGVVSSVVEKSIRLTPNRAGVTVLHG